MPGPLNTYFVGNTWGSAGGQWVQPGLNAMAVWNGIVIGLITWEEGVRELRTYGPGQTTGNPPYTYLHNDIPNGGNGVATDGTYVYAAVLYSNHAGIQRYNLSDLSIAPFTGADGYPEGGCPPSNCWRMVNATYEYLGQFTIDTVNQELYVIDPHDTGGNPIAKQQATGAQVENATVNVYNTGLSSGSVLALKRSFAIPRCRSISYDGQGGIWVIQEEDSTNSRTISRYSSTGALLRTLGSPITGAVDVCCDTVNNRLLISDAGSDQNIKVYNNLTNPTSGTAIGTQSGYLAGPTPGTIGPLRFMDPRWLAFDNGSSSTRGYLHVANTPLNNGWIVDGTFVNNGGNAGLYLEAYDTTLTRNWHVWCHRYSSTAALDTTTNNDAYDDYYHYQYNGTTSTFEPVGLMLNKFANYSDQRYQDVGNGISPGGTHVMYISGHKFLVLTSGSADSRGCLWIYRFTAATGEVAIPCVAFQPISNPTMNQAAGHEFIWRDLSGDGNDGQGNEFSSGPSIASLAEWYIDAASNIWEAMQNAPIRRFRNQGLDANGVPIYDYSHMDSYNLPALSGDSWNYIGRVAYNSVNDVMYLLGYTNSFPKPTGEANKFAGRVIARYNSWTTGPTLAWKTTLASYDTAPNTDIGHKSICFDWANANIFVGYFSHIAGAAQNQDIEVYDTATGTLQSTIIPTNFSQIGSRSGNLDSTGGLNAYSISGGYYIFAEDDGWNKTIIYPYGTFSTNPPTTITLTHTVDARITTAKQHTVDASLKAIPIIGSAPSGGIGGYAGTEYNDDFYGSAYTTVAPPPAPPVTLTGGGYGATAYGGVGYADISFKGSASTRWTDLSSSTQQDRLWVVNNAAIHLSDGTLVFLDRDASGLYLKFSFDHKTINIISTMTTTEFNLGFIQFVTLVVDSLDNIYIVGVDNTNQYQLRVKAFTKGAGYTWTAQTSISASRGADTNGISTLAATWCNTGGGTNTKGHLMVVLQTSTANQNAYAIVDAGVALAGTGTLITGSGVNPTFLPFSSVAGSGLGGANLDLDNDGFGNSSGLAVSAYTDTAYCIGAWAISSSGTLVTNNLITNALTASTLTNRTKLNLIRFATNKWALVYPSSSIANNYMIAIYSSSAQVVAGIDCGTPGGVNFVSNTLGWDAYLDPTFHGQIWVSWYDQTGAFNLRALVGAGVIWDTFGNTTNQWSPSATGLDSLDMRIVKKPNVSKVDFQVYVEDTSATHYALWGDFVLLHSALQYNTDTILQASATNKSHFVDARLGTTPPGVARWKDLDSILSSDRMATLSNATIHLSDGTLVFLEIDSSNLYLKYSSNHTTLNTIAFLSLTEFYISYSQLITVVRDASDNLYIIGSDNSLRTDIRVKAFTKGVGFTWAAQAGISSVRGADTNPITQLAATWCNTGGGTNSKGHLMVVLSTSTTNQNAYVICDAGVALAGTGTLVTASGVNPTFLPYNTLMFSDDFTGASNTPPDPTKWNVQQGNWDQSSLDLDTQNIANCFQDGSGNLRIVALHQPNTTINGVTKDYTSARIDTYQHFETKHGKIEMRAMLPNQQGIWPAFWMVGDDIYTDGWPQCGEIDIMESAGSDVGTSTVDQHIHGPLFSNPNIDWQVGGSYTESSDITNWHIYTLQWTSNSLQFFVDNVLVRTITPANLASDDQWVFDNHPFFIILDIAVGGTFPGNIDANTSFPQTMVIDYVKAWDLDNVTATAGANIDIDNDGFGATSGIATAAYTDASLSGNIAVGAWSVTSGGALSTNTSITTSLVSGTLTNNTKIRTIRYASNKWAITYPSTANNGHYMAATYSSTAQITAGTECGSISGALYQTQTLGWAAFLDTLTANQIYIVWYDANGSYKLKCSLGAGIVWDTSISTINTWAPYGVSIPDMRIVKKPYGQPIDLQAFVQTSPTNYALWGDTIDTLLKYGVDVIVKRSIPVIYTVDADLKKLAITLTQSVDAFMSNTKVLSYSLDADLKQSNSFTYNVDVLLRRARTYTVDALLHGPPKAYQVDALIHNVKLLSYSVDLAPFGGRVYKSMIVDCRIRKNGATIIQFVDAEITNSLSTLTHGVDAVLQHHTDVYYVDSVLKAVGTALTYLADAMLPHRTTITHNVDCFDLHKNINYQGDALLAARTPITHTTDAQIVPGNKKVVTVIIMDRG